MNASCWPPDGVRAALLMFTIMLLFADTIAVSAQTQSSGQPRENLARHSADHRHFRVNNGVSSIQKMVKLLKIRLSFEAGADRPT
jgi:hypothetical protein